MTTDALKLAWIAGFFDGEGHCGMQSTLTKYGYVYHLNVTIINTNLETLKLIQNLLGLGFIESKNVYNPKHKTGYHLDFPMHHLGKFLEAIQPYVITKARQIELVLEYYKELRGKALNDEISDRRKKIYHEISALNQRGVK